MFHIHGNLSELAFNCVYFLRKFDLIVIYTFRRPEYVGNA